MNRQRIYAIILVVFTIGLAVFILAAVGGFKLFSVIGEEGYEHYDRAMLANTHDKNHWIHNPNQKICKQKYNAAGENCLVPYDGVSVSDNTISANSMYGFPSYELRTKNLRLADFRTTAIIDAGNSYGGACVSTNKGSVWCYTPSYGASRSSSVSIELLWNDYELGHYQINVNNRIVQEGTIKENEELYFILQPTNGYGNNFDGASVRFKNPRVRSLFSCDPQVQGVGQTVTDACFGGPKLLTTKDLPGFQKFCPAFSAIKCTSGVCAPSKQVYYSLARGEPVIIDENTVWKFSYIDSDPTYGGKVGISSRCDDPVLTENTIDLNETTTVEGDRTIVWNTNHERLNLMSGKRSFFTTETPQYLCKGKDGLSTPAKFSYPTPDANCYQLNINGKTFTPDKTVELEHFSIKVRNANIKMIYGENTQDQLVEPGFRSPSDWNVMYEATLKKPLITDVRADIPKGVLLKEQREITLTVNNQYDRHISTTILLDRESEITGQHTTIVLNQTLKPGANALSFTLPTDVLGKQSIDSIITVNLEGESLLAAEQTTLTYTVYSDLASLRDGADLQPPAEQGFFAKLWTLIKNFFRGAA